MSYCRKSWSRNRTGAAKNELKPEAGKRKSGASSGTEKFEIIRPTCSQLMHALLIPTCPASYMHSPKTLLWALGLNKNVPIYNLLPHAINSESITGMISLIYIVVLWHEDARAKNGLLLGTRSQRTSFPCPIILTL